MGRFHLVRASFSGLILVLFLLGRLTGAPVPPDIKSIVTFVFVQNLEGDGIVPSGTGFFVGVRVDTDAYRLHLVTAKHVLQRPDSKEFYKEVVLRINTKDGGNRSRRIKLVTSGDQRNVFFHSDSSVDLAVIPVSVNQSIFDFKFLPDSLITTQAQYKEMKIAEGSDVFFTGLFTGHVGSERNYPIVRFGRVALVTDEKIEWDGAPTELYLIEAASYGGNSGSPVFFYLGSDREPGRLVVGSPILRLAGIMQGTFLDHQAIRVVETKKVPISVSSMGIAAVVPAYKLHEILFGEELKWYREKRSILNR